MYTKKQLLNFGGGETLGCLIFFLPRVWLLIKKRSVGPQAMYNYVGVTTHLFGQRW